MNIGDLLTIVQFGALPIGLLAAGWYWRQEIADWTRTLMAKTRYDGLFSTVTKAQIMERFAPIPAIPTAPINPPSFERVITEVRAITGRRYIFPIGWAMHGERAALISTDLWQEVNHILVSGQNDSGKDNLVRIGLLTLALQHSPEELQFALVDGKGLDWHDWRDKAHTWALAEMPNELSGVITRLTKERERRIEILKRAGCKKWQTYQGGGLPLLVVYVSELKLIRQALGGNSMEEWLAAELAVSRAAGIRYIIGTQTATRMGTDWRSQIALYIAGRQPARSQDEPNANLTADDIERLGMVPPSSIDLPGVFAAVCGKDVRNIRATFLDDETLDRYLAALPDRVSSVLDVPVRVPVPANMPVFGQNRVVPAILVPADTTGTGHQEAVNAGTGDNGAVPAGTSEELLHQAIKALHQSGWSKNKIIELFGRGGRKQNQLNWLNQILGQD